ncbi:hypothetical protein AX15_005568 [Amanita polypyramis BW_CC]|nr:hypothetical protein AX15_005568 [Amanita polypyramis BW_CC]
MTSDDHSTIHDIHQVDEIGKKELGVDITFELTSFPEGGLWGWLAVAGSFLLQFSCFGYMLSFGVYNDYYIRVYLNEKYTSSQISWIGSVQLFVVLTTCMISGRAFDAGYFYHIIISGTMLFSFSLFMLSLSHPQQYYQVFLAQGLGNSIAIGMLTIPGFAIVSHYFKRRRGLAMGIATAGAAVGGTVHPIMLNRLFYGQAGFHNGVRASAGLNVGLLILAVLFMKPRLPPKKHEGSLLINLRTFLREPGYLLAMLGMTFTAVGFYVPSFYLQLYAIKHGVTPTLAFYSITFLNAVSLFGRVMPGLIVDKCGGLNLTALCTLGCAIIIFCQLAATNAPGIIVFGIVYGFFSGAFGGLLGPMLSALAKNDSEIGARMGIGYSFAGIGGLIGNPIAGALLTSSYIWWRPILFTGIFVTLGAACFLSSWFIIAKEKGRIFV